MIKRIIKDIMGISKDTKLVLLLYILTGIIFVVMGLTINRAFLPIGIGTLSLLIGIFVYYSYLQLRRG